MEPLEQRQMLSVVSWDGGGDGQLWSDPVNWTDDALPTSNDDVVIDVSTNPTVRISTDTTVASLQCAEALLIESGAFAVSGSLTLTNTSSLTSDTPTASFTSTGPATINGANLTATAGGSIEITGVTSYTQNGGDRTLQATGAGSQLSLPNLETITGRSGGYDDLFIRALDGGVVDLPSATSVPSGAVHFKADGTDSLIDISALTDFNGYFYGTSSGFEATNAGEIVCPSLTTVTSGHITATNAGQIVCPSLTTVTTGNITLDGTGVMDTAQIVSYSGGGYTLNVSDISRDFTGLQTLANVILTIDGTDPQFEVLSNIDDSSLTVTNNVDFELPNVTSYTQNANADRSLQATGAGSQLSLPNLETITGRSGGYDDLFIRALDGGVVDLPSATSVPSGAVHFKADGTDSLIDISALTDFNGYFYGTSSGFEATNAGEIVCPSLTTVTSGHITATIAGQIVCPSLTTVTTGNITLDGTGVMDTAQIVSYSGGGYTLNVSDISRDFTGLQTLANVILTIDGTDPQFSVLSNIDGSSLTVTNNVDFELPNVTSYTQNANADRSLQATGAGSQLSLPNLETITGRSGGYDDLFIRALDGGVVDLPSATSVPSGAVHFKADGTDSLIDISALTDFNGYFYGTSSGFEATNAGEIVCPSLTTVTSGHITATNAGQIVCPSLTTVTTGNITLDGTGVMDTAQIVSYSGGGYTLNVSDISRDFTGLQTLANVILTIDGTDPQFSVLSNIDGSSLTVTNNVDFELPNVTSYTQNANADRSLQATGAGSQLSLPNLETITGRSGGYDDLFIRALDGGVVDLPSATSVPSGAVHFKADGTDSLIDISALTDFNGYFYGTSSGFEATNAGEIVCPSLTTVTSGHITATNAGQIVCPSLTTVTTGNITLDGTGVMDTAQIVSYSGGGYTLNVSDISRDFTGLQTLANVILTIDGTDPQFSVLSNIDGSSLTVTNNVDFELPNVTSYTQNANADRSLQATGAGSQLSLPNLETITGRSGGYDDLFIRALDGGVVDLPSATSVPSGAVHFKADGTDSLIDISALTDFNGYFYGTSSGFEATNAGEIVCPSLTTVTSGHITATIAGQIVCPSLTTVTTGNITLDGTGVMDTAQIVSYSGGGYTLNVSDISRDFTGLQTLANVILTIDGTDPQFSVLSNIDGSSLTVTNNVDFELPNVTSYTQNANADRSLQATGAGSQLSLPNLETITGRSGGYDDLFIRALDGGVVDLPSATSVPSGAVHFKADGTDSLIDISALTDFNGYFYGTSSGFEATNAGEINVGTAVSGTNVATGIVRVDATGSLVCGNLVLGGGADLKGVGTVSGDVTNVGGIVGPGDAVGSLTIDGDFTQAGSGKLVIELGGTIPGSQHDLLVVTGTATLGGVLATSRVDGYLPPVGAEFSVVEAAVVDGAFERFENLAIGGGIKMSPLYDPAAVRLQAIVDAGPKVVASSMGGSIDGPLMWFDVDFDEPIDVLSFTGDDVILTGPNGAVAVTDISQVVDNTYRIALDAQVTPGLYSLTLGPDVTDAAGNPMDQNGNATNGEPTDVFTADITVTDVEQAVLLVNVKGGYNADAWNLYQTLLAAGARAKWIDLDVENEAADALAADTYDQVWVFDLSTSTDAYTADWQAIGDWFNQDPTRAVVCDARILSSYWRSHWQTEGMALTENYYRNLEQAGGGLILGTDSNQFHSGINSINTAIDIDAFSSNFSTAPIPVDTQNPLMTAPNDLGTHLIGDSSPGQSPHGFQANGSTLYTVARNDGDFNTPGISSTIAGQTGFQLEIIAPADGTIVTEDTTISFVSSHTGGTEPYSFAWTSDRDGSLGTGETLDVSTLSPGVHIIDVLGQEAGGGSDVDSITVTIELLSTDVQLDLQTASDTGASGSDNLTADTSPTFDVTVNKAGLIEIDIDGDGTPDQSQTAAAAGTFSFTSTELADGLYSVVASMTPTQGDPAEQTLGLTIDTLGPYLLPGVGEEQAPLFGHDFHFNEPLDAAASRDVQAALTGPGGGNIPLGLIGFSSDRFRIDFGPVIAPGVYTFTIDTGIFDRAGNAVDQDQDGVPDGPVDTFRLWADVTAPFVLSSTPAGAQNSDVSEWTVEFSEMMDPASFDTEDLTLTGPAGAIDTSTFVISSTDHRVFTIATSVLADEGTYAVAVGPNVDDASGNPLGGSGYLSTFTIDKSPPSVMSVSPSGTVASAVASIDMTFDEPIDASTFGIDDVQISGPDGLVTLSNPTSISENVFRLSLATLRTAGIYNVTVGPNITDTAGNAMTSAFDSSFTLSLPDLIPSGVVAPTMAFPGSEVALSWSVDNVGNVSAGPWETRVYMRSTQPGAEDILLGTFPYSDVLLPTDLPLTRHETVTIPEWHVSGESRFVVLVDSGDSLAELDEINNRVECDTTTVVPTVLAVALPVDEVREDVADPVLYGLVSRTGRLDAPLVVSLISNLPDELTVPSDVTIPAGLPSVRFPVDVQDDGQLDGDQWVEVVVTAADCVGGVDTLLVLDAQTPVLSLSLDVTQLDEGAQATGTATRDYVTDQPLVVHLSPCTAGQLDLPTEVTIPANQAEVSFTLTALDDDRYERDSVITLTATALGFDPIELPVQVLDNDAPDFVIELPTTSLSESSGATAIVATLRTSTPYDTDMAVSLSSSDTTAAIVPDQVILPTGHTFVNFNIGAVDDDQVDGDQWVTLTARWQAALGGCDSISNESGSVSADLLVTDDDGPTLSLIVDSSLLPEGLSSATMARVVRNTGTVGQLEVTLASGDTSELTLPLTAIIADGADTSDAFPIATLEDGISDGAQQVALTASADGFAPGVVLVTVTDVDVPDLVVGQLTGPETAYTERYADIDYTVTNAGLAESIASNADPDHPDGPFPGSWQDRVFLSDDPYIGNDLLVGTYTYTGTLSTDAPLDHYSRTVPFRAPMQPGDYWIVVTTDLGATVFEGIETNNTSVSADPIHVEATYRATVSTDVELDIAGTPIPMTGHAIDNATGGPAAYALVNIHLSVRGFERIISAIADESGNFSTTFQPLPGEAGAYEISATHPGVSNAGATQDTFVLMGMESEPRRPTLTVAEGSSESVQLDLDNLSDVPLSDLVFSVTDKPDNLEVTLPPSLPTSLSGLGRMTLSVDVEALDDSVIDGTVVLHVTSAEGASLDIPIAVTVRGLRSQLMIEPGHVVASVLRGGQKAVEFQITNSGAAATGPIEVRLPNLDWLSLATAEQMASIGVDDSSSVVLLLSPPPNATLTAYNGNLILATDHGELSVPFTFRMVSDAVGDLQVSAVDEYFFFTAEAPKLEGASIRVLDAVSREEVHTATTDAGGTFTFADLPEGYYTVEVRALDHDTFTQTLFLEAGQTNHIEAYLPYQTVKYIWSVEEIEIEDRYKINIETVFETNVPAPVVTVDPPVIDMSDLLLPGQRMQIDLTYTNHGLISAYDMEIFFGDHPEIKVTPLVNYIGELPAKSSFSVPVLIERIDPNPQAAASFAPDGLAAFAPMPAAASMAAANLCTLPGYTVYRWVCKGDQRKGIPLYIVPPSNFYCPPPLPPGSGGGGGGGGGGGVASYIPVYVQSSKTCVECVERELVGINLSSYLDFLKQPIKDIAGLVPLINKGDLKVDLSASGSLRVCCNEDGSSGLLGELQGEAELAVPFVAGISLSAPTGTIVSVLNEVLAPLNVQASLSGSIFLGGQIRPSIKGQGSYKDGCEYDELLEGSITAGLDGKLGGEAKLTASLSGSGVVEFASQNDIFDYTKVELDMHALWKTGLFGELTYSSTTGWSGRACFEGIYADASISLQLGKWKRSVSIPSNDPCDPENSSKWYLAMPACYGGPWCDTTQSSEPILSPATMVVDSTSAVPDADPGVCARVKLRLEQEVVMSRSVFEAELELNNQLSTAPLENLSVRVSAMDKMGENANTLFGIQEPRLLNITKVDGSGLLQSGTSGTATWLILPTDSAAPIGPTEYFIGGIMEYDLEGVHFVVPLEAVSITVIPDAALDIDYFHQRDVFADDPWTDEIEPSKPYELAVMVQNHGAGDATNLRIESAQPKIIENEKGLLIDFKIIASEVDGQNMTPSLTADFGDIAPGDNAIGRWWMTSTLQGQFIDYEATFEHVTGLGDERLSLIKNVEIHELIHTVSADGSWDDGRPDFLVNDLPDPNDLPDTLYLSDGGMEQVGLATGAITDGVVTKDDLEIVLNVDMDPGWNYLRMQDLDPGASDYRLVRVVRSDASELPVENFWQTDRTFIELGRRPLLENSLHLFDRQTAEGTQTYTLYYEVRDQTGPQVATLEQPGPVPVVEAVDSLDITFSEALDAVTFDLGDITLTRDGGVNLLPATASIQQIDATNYRINGLTDLTADDGLYTLSVSAPGVEDLFGNPGVGEQSMSWAKTAAVPGIAHLEGPTSNLLALPVESLSITFTEPIQSDSLDRDDLTLTLDNSPVDLSLHTLSFTQTGPQTYRVDGLQTATAAEGSYRMAVSASGVTDLADKAGFGSAKLIWTMDTTPPAVVSLFGPTAASVDRAVQSVLIVFPEPLVSFEVTALSLRLDGGPNLLDPDVMLSPPSGLVQSSPDLLPPGVELSTVDDVTYLLSGLETLTDADGRYQLVVDTTSLHDLAGNVGMGTAGVAWTMDTTPPAAATNLVLAPDTGVSASDGITNQSSLTLSGDLGETDLTVTIFDETTGTELGMATVTGTHFTYDLDFTSSGNHRLKISTLDPAGNDTDSFFDVFVDLTHPMVAGVDVATAPVDQLGVTFLEDVDLSSRIADATILSSVELVDLARGPVPLRVDQFAYNASSHQLGLSLDEPLPGGIYELRIDGSQVADISGNLLHGGTGGLSLDVTTFGAAEMLTADGSQIQVDVYSVPSAVDWNADGRLDLIVGEKTLSSQGKVRVYLNQATSTTPAFETFFYAQAGGADLAVPASGCLGVFPRMFDWDQDGRNDLVLGLADGTVQVALNENTNAEPRFGMPANVQYGQPGAKTDIDVGTRATLDIVDWNNDGNYDLLVGAMDGKVRVFFNEADSGAADFHTSTLVLDGSFLLAVSSGRSSVAVADLNADGRKDLVLGDTVGQLRFYPNLGTDATPAFDGWQPIQADGVTIDLPGTPRSRPFVGDINDDGILDLLVGSEDGTIRRYSGVTAGGYTPSVTDSPGDTYVHTFQVPDLPETSLDVDGNGEADALTDGIIILRYLFGFTGDPMIEGAIAPDATRTDPVEIADYLDAERVGMLDVDANGVNNALTDGMIILRYLFDFNGVPLIENILGTTPPAQRTDPAEIVDFLDGLNPTISPAAAAAPLASPDADSDRAKLETTAQDDFIATESDWTQFSQSDVHEQEALFDILAYESIKDRPTFDAQNEVDTKHTQTFDLILADS